MKPDDLREFAKKICLGRPKKYYLVLFDLHFSYLLKKKLALSWDYMLNSCDE